VGVSDDFDAIDLVFLLKSKRIVKRWFTLHKYIIQLARVLMTFGKKLIPFVSKNDCISIE
jgi:hypothetical protein